jgi:hypothetical protein
MVTGAVSEPFHRLNDRFRQCFALMDRLRAIKQQDRFLAGQHAGGAGLLDSKAPCWQPEPLSRYSRMRTSPCLRLWSDCPSANDTEKTPLDKTKPATHY